VDLLTRYLKSANKPMFVVDSLDKSSLLKLVSEFNLDLNALLRCFKGMTTEEKYSRYFLCTNLGTECQSIAPLHKSLLTEPDNTWAEWITEDILTKPHLYGEHWLLVSESVGDAFGFISDASQENY
jgi:hypothetical protein